jgi:acetyl esterase/lipase
MSSKNPKAIKGVRAIETVAYSQAGGKPRLADVYVPTGKGPFPAIIFLHGGGWRYGDRQLGPDLSQFFAMHGFVMVSIDYRLSDEAFFPASVIDTKTAIRWLRAHAENFDVDPAQIGLWGSSSGGHLAAMAALSGPDTFTSPEWSAADGSVQAVAQGYGPMDFLQIDAHKDSDALPGTDPESVKVPNPKPAGDPGSLESLYLGGAIGERSDLVQQASPLTYAKAVSCPFLIMHGTFDAAIPVHQSQLLFDALTQAGGDCRLMVFDGLGHGFLNRNGLDDDGPHAVTIKRDGAADQQTTAEIFGTTLAFFQRALSGRPH